MIPVRFSGREPVRTSLSSFVANLPEMLGAFYGHDEPMVAIVFLSVLISANFFVQEDSIVLIQIIPTIPTVSLGLKIFLILFI